MSVSWFEKLLCRILPYRDIVKTVDGQELLYLRRFFLRRSKAESQTGDEGGTFLHVIHRSDDDRDPHDHPWDFKSLILSGGYTDEQWEVFPGADPNHLGSIIPFGTYRRWSGDEAVQPGMVVSRAAEHTNRVRLLEGKPAWTLVWTGPRRRSWGFWTEHGWSHWREYLGIPKRA